MRDNQAPIRCPRCGYDQRGLVSSWRDYCPLQSVCTECGLHIEWRAVFDPTVTLPRWCVEAPRSAWAASAQFFGTAWRCWLSGKLWRGVQMFHPTQWPRLSGWIAGWLLLIVLSAMLANGLTALGLWSAIAAGGARGVPLTTTGAWPVFLQATLLPLSGKSIGQYTLPGFAGTLYAAPADFFVPLLRRMWVWLTLLHAAPVCCGLTFAALPVSRRRAKIRWSHIGRSVCYAYGLVGLVAVLMLLQRGENALAGYTGFPRAVPMGAAGPAGVQSLRLLAGVVAISGTALAVALVPATLGFWWSCARNYLRMEQAWAVALSVTIIGLLAPVSVYGALWYWLG